jgi:hypothetical protein
MEIEAIGAITIILAGLAWFAGGAVAIYIFVSSTLLSAAAAMVLPSLGGASIQPAHLLLGLLVLVTVAGGTSLRVIGNKLAFPHEGFWLLLTAAYAVLAAIFLPRIFAGATYVFAIARTEIGQGLVALPLAPTAGNITQTVYFLGDLVCFLVFCSYAAKPSGLTAMVWAILAAAALNLGFAAIDVIGYWSGVGDPLAVIRNADYRMLNDASVLGFKRIVGSFPEASTFAYFTAGFFAFCTRLWLTGIHRRVTGTLALMSLCALALSTSSTGYAATLTFLLVLFLVCVGRALTRPVPRAVVTLIVVMPLLVVGGSIGLRLYSPAWTALHDMIDQTVFDKLGSESGLERTRWNEQAMTNLADTDGLGAGVGSVRASSFPIAVLGNIGLPGAALYGIFLLQLLLARKNRWQAPFPAACQDAARWACFTQLVGASVAGSFIDLGLPFFVLAGLACADPQSVLSRPAVRMAAPLAAGAA